MKHIQRLCLVSAFLFLILSCSTVKVASQMNDATCAPAADGYLFTVIDINRPCWDVSIMPYKENGTYSIFQKKTAVFENLDSGIHVVLLRIPEGSYVFKYITYKNSLFEIDGIRMDVIAGVVTYAGRLVIKITNTSESNPGFTCQFVGAYESDLEQLNRDNPDVLESLPIRKQEAASAVLHPQKTWFF